jgi:hypothetical protein
MGYEKKLNEQTGLTKGEMAFCERYDKTGDAGKSYLGAFKEKCSYKTAEGKAFALLHKPKVKKYLQVLRSRSGDEQQQFFINAQNLAKLFFQMYQDTNNVAERGIAFKALEALGKSKFCNFFEQEQTNVNILNVQDSQRIDALLKAPNPETGYLGVKDTPNEEVIDVEKEEE